MNKWYSNDNFWNDLYDFIFDEEKQSLAVSQISDIEKLTGISSGKVLDIPCGPGRHIPALCEKGFSVTGVDLNERLLERGHKNLAKAGHDAELIKADMRDFKRACTYDLAINMFTSLGYFNDHEEEVKVLKNIKASLKPGGKALFEMVGKEVLAKIFENETSAEGKDGSRLTMKHEILNDWTRVKNTWTLKHGDDSQTYEFEQTIFSAHEMKLLLQEAGFGEVKIYGGLDGRAYNNNAQRLIAVASTKGA